MEKEVGLEDLRLLHRAWWDAVEQSDDHDSTSGEVVGGFLKSPLVPIGSYSR